MEAHLNGLGLVRHEFRFFFYRKRRRGMQLGQSQIVDPVYKIAETGGGSQVSWPLSRAELVFEGGTKWG